MLQQFRFLFLAEWTRDKTNHKDDLQPQLPGEELDITQLEAPYTLGRTFSCSTLRFLIPFILWQRVFQPVWWEEVYRSSSVCKSGRCCCQNTAYSQLHQPQPCRLAFNESCSATLFMKSFLFKYWWLRCFLLLLETINHLLLIFPQILDKNLSSRSLNASN